MDFFSLSEYPADCKKGLNLVAIRKKVGKPLERAVNGGVLKALPWEMDGGGR